MLVEVSGVKIEFDERQARTVESFKVGDQVKVLVKHYGDTFTSNPGVIVGFDNFKNLPTIVVAYVYGGQEIKFAYINEGSKDLEICHWSGDLQLQKANVLDWLDSKIRKSQEEIRDLEQKKSYFLSNFGKYFEDGNIA